MRNARSRHCGIGMYIRGGCIYKVYSIYVHAYSNMFSRQPQVVQSTHLIFMLLPIVYFLHVASFICLELTRPQSMKHCNNKNRTQTKLVGKVGM